MTVTRDDPYTGRAAAIRAGIFFAIAGMLPFLLLVLPRLLNGPAIARDGSWFVLAPLLLAVVINGYVVLWPRGTFTEDRPRRWTWQVGFGLAWGLTMGTIHSSLWIVAGHLFPDNGAVAGVLAWVLASMFQGLWHQLYWDHKVSPPHNVTRWNLIKVGAAHVPNITLSMIVLAQYGDLPFVILMQMIALTSSSIAMRFPSPSYVRSPDLDALLAAREAGEQA